MSNRLLLWLSLFLPWLTLFFMKKEEIRRFLPVAWFTVVMNVVLYDFGISLNWWKIMQNAYPFTEIPPFFFGAYVVITIWIFKLSYRKFWLYAIYNAVFDTVYAFLVLPWLSSRGIFSDVNYVVVFFLAISQAIVIYGYQMWSEGRFSSVQELFSPRLQPAATKPLPEDLDEKRDNG